MVAAAAAWLRAAKPNLKADQVASTLRASAIDLGSKGWDSATGFGLLSMTARAALRDAGGRPARAERRHGVGGRPRLGTRTARSGRGSRPTAARAASTSSGPGRRLPHRPPEAAKIRVTLEPRFGTPTSPPSPAAPPRPPTTSRSSAAPAQRETRDTLTLRNPAERSRAAFLVAYIDQDTRRSTPATTSGAAPQARLIASLPCVWVAGSAASASPRPRGRSCAGSDPRCPQQRAEPVERDRVGLAP